MDRVQLETFVDGVITQAMASDHIAGVGLAVVDRSGPLLVKGYGVAAPGRSVGPDTLFPQQSISKTLVWIAVMQLVEQGRVRLSDPVNRRLPPALQIPGDRNFGVITVGDLMSHTAGFEDSAFGHLILDRADRLSPLETYLATHRPRRVRPAGAEVVYSNYGAALAGEIVAHVTGEPWEAYAEAHILRPLGMSEATFRQPYTAQLAMAKGLPAPMPADLQAHLTDGFRWRAGRLEPAPREFTADAPAGALSASPRAMGRFVQALLDPDVMARAGVLSRATAQDLRTPLVHGPAGFGDMRHGFAAMAMPGDLVAWGHMGDSVYQVANISVLPDAGLAISISANTTTGHRLVEDLRQRLAERFLGARPQPLVYGAGARAAAEQVSGLYRTLRRPFARSERGFYDLLIDDLAVSATGDGDLMLRSAIAPPRRFGPLGGGVYREFAGAERIAFRTVRGRVELVQPYAETAWARLGLFDGPGWIVAVVLAALTAALLTILRWAAGLHAGRGLGGASDGLAIGASIAWLGGATLFVATLLSELGGETPAEIMFSYPAPTWIAALWVWALAAALSAGTLFAALARWRTHGWGRQDALRIAAGVVWLGAGVVLAREGLLGFSGW